MTPNIECAKQYFNTHFAENGVFDEYSAAYAVTNEDLRHAMRFIPKNTENALVVAGSGDHPMFAALCNAKNIDAFDITYNAKLIMDIKTTALKILNRDEYQKLVIDLYKMGDKIESIENMQPIIKKLSHIEQKYISEMRGHNLFCHGLHPSGYIKRPVPYEPEYNQMRKVINKPFNFIWSDITTLHTKLNKKYDFIHLSNIMDYMNERDGADTVISLLKYTRPGSVICFQSMYMGIPTKLYDYCTKMAQNNGDKWTFRHSKSDTMLYIMHRER